MDIYFPQKLQLEVVRWLTGLEAQLSSLYIMLFCVSNVCLFTFGGT